MTRCCSLSAVVAMVIVATPCFAGEHKMKANDAGGIIPWSSTVAPAYRRIAADHCARFDKNAVITSVHRRDGDYVGFRCFFPRGYDPRKGVWAKQPGIAALN